METPTRSIQRTAFSACTAGSLSSSTHMPFCPMCACASMISTPNRLPSSRRDHSESSTGNIAVALFGVSPSRRSRFPWAMSALSSALMSAFSNGAMLAP